jgi:hypothetical protein
MPGLYRLRGWKVISGPPDVEIGSEYYADIIAASDRKWAELEGRDLIPPRRLCAKCGARLPVWDGAAKSQATATSVTLVVGAKVRKAGPHSSQVALKKPHEMGIPRAVVARPSRPCMLGLAIAKWGAKIFGASLLPGAKFTISLTMPPERR